MRTIKFRAWIHKPIESYMQYFVMGELLHAGAGEPMQFTGLKDKDGKEIYEGDLLKDGKKQIGKVFYSDKTASFLVNWYMEDGSWETDGCLGYGEVVGNIHENGDLLK